MSSSGGVERLVRSDNAVVFYGMVEDWTCVRAGVRGRVRVSEIVEMCQSRVLVLCV